MRPPPPDAAEILLGKILVTVGFPLLIFGLYLGTSPFLDPVEPLGASQETAFPVLPLLVGILLFGLGATMTAFGIKFVFTRPGRKK